jgi:hypothetical protein
MYRRVDPICALLTVITRVACCSKIVEDQTSDMSNRVSAIDITTKMFPLAFLLLFFKTNVSIDGDARVIPWGDSHYDVLPGQHEVEISFKYFFSRKMGSQKIGIEVGEGKTVSLRYRPSFLVTMPGSITIH